MVGSVKCRVVKMCSKLREHQCKITCKQVVTHELHGKYKLKFYNRYTQKRKRNPHTILKLVIKYQEERTQKGKKTPTKRNQKQLTKWQ